MADDAHLILGSFRPPAEWWRLHTAERLTPEGFRETSLLRKEIDCRAIVRAAHEVMTAPARSTPRKLMAMQLVDIYTVEHLPSPHLVLRALDAALDLDDHFALTVRNKKIAALHQGGMTQKEIATKLGVSKKTVQRYCDPAPDPWPHATAALAAYRPMSRMNDLDHHNRSVRKQSRKAWSQHERIKRALAPIHKRASELAAAKQGPATRASVFDIVLWFAGRGQPLPPPVRWAVAVALQVGDERVIKQSVFEKIWPSPGPARQLVCDKRGEPVITNDDRGEPAFLAGEVKPEKRVGMRLLDRYRKSIEIEAGERIKRGKPYEPTNELKNLADDVSVTPETMTAWRASKRWKTAVSSRARYPILNAIQCEASAKLRGKKVLPEELAEVVDVATSDIETWRNDPDYQARVNALVEKMRVAEETRVKRLKARLDERGTGPTRDRTPNADSG